MIDDLNPIWVDSPEGVAAAAEAAGEKGHLALDTEADSLHSYFHKTCLIQVTAGDGNIVIDPLAMEHESLAPLWRLVEDPDLPVLMHGSDYDIRVLDRDYGIRIRGLVDTQIMAQVLGEPKTGLAALLEKELGVALDKRHQRADWGRRPLTPSQIAYAAADTAFLESLAVRLRDRLREMSRWEWAEEDFRRLEKVRHRPVEPDPRAFERVKGVRSLKGRARDRAFSLYQWRENEAQRLDVPPFKVLGNRQLVTMAENPPADSSELVKLDGVGPRFVRRWGTPVLAVLRRPERAPERRPKARRPDLSAGQVRLVKALSALRDEAAGDLGVEPGLICPRACVESVATHSPPCRSLDDLRAAGIDGWRLEVLGSRYLACLADVE
ncbi:MAG: HRDC domain-containing protein [Thermoanaerobaculales bacterium]|jgi:ribonuclease D|nr:HRDC domain-containing protein [Thermoanaerobaculales bacterium]